MSYSDDVDLEREDVSIGNVLYSYQWNSDTKHRFFRVESKSKKNLPCGVWLPNLYGEWTDIPGSAGQREQRTVRPDLSAIVPSYYTSQLSLGGEGRTKLRFNKCSFDYYDANIVLTESRTKPGSWSAQHQYD